MSSFGGVAFKVVPKSGFFPNVEPANGDSPAKYSCDAVIIGVENRDLLLKKTGRGTAERILGTEVYNWHHESGTPPTTLIVPVYGGTQATFTQAVLQSISNVEGYGVFAQDQFRCSMDFIILSNITP